MSLTSGSEPNQYADHVVVLVPGIFSPRVTMWPMARRFKRQGYQTLIFQNRYLLKTPEQNAQRLRLILRGLTAARVHLLGHSLGGIVIMHALRLNTEQPAANRFATGKVVLIASPVNGSEFARLLHSKRLLRPLMSRCAVGGVLNGMPEELDGRETGVISGSARMGLAAMIYKPEHLSDGSCNRAADSPNGGPNSSSNDGMINEFETRLSGARDAITVPQSHASMLFSRHCTELAIRFLRYGRFVADG